MIRGLEAVDHKMMEQNILPLAVGVDLAGDGPLSPAYDGPMNPEARRLMQEIKLEEEKSRKLDAIMKVLAENEAQDRNILDGLLPNEVDLVLKSDGVAVSEDVYTSMPLSWKESQETKQVADHNPEMQQEDEAGDEVHFPIPCTAVMIFAGV